MTTQLINGQRTWTLARDEFGYREYRVKHLIKADRSDGPFLVLNTPGLPLPGSWWIIDNDIDLWVWCRQTADVKPLTENEPNEFWEVEQVFSNKPLDLKRCNDIRIEDPLLEPPKISGTFAKYQEEAVLDRFDEIIRTSSFELIHGPQNEWDNNRPTVRIEKNVPIFNLPLYASMVDTVNDVPMWGLDDRCIKLSNFSWERKFYGACYTYYTLVFDFDIRYESFDRFLADEGAKVLNGRWHPVNGCWELIKIGGGLPDFNNPNHYSRAVDRVGNQMRMMLNGEGLPANVIMINGEETPFTITPCCPNPIPQTLYATFTDTTGDCNNVRNYFLFEIRLSNEWVASFTIGGVPVTFTLTCPLSGGSMADMTLTGTGITAQQVTFTACEPFNIVYNLEYAGPFPCSGTGILSIYGSPIVGGTPTGPPGKILVEKYRSTNFGLLGLPQVF